MLKLHKEEQSTPHLLHKVNATILVGNCITKENTMRSDNAHFRSLNAAIAKMQSEDYQTPERARQTYNTGVEGSKQDSNEKRSKKVYGKDGKVVHASLANMRRSLNKKSKKVAESVESAEYTELLESVLLALCEELELDPVALLEDWETTERKNETKRVLAKLPKASKAYTAAKNKQSAERGSNKVHGKGGRVVAANSKAFFAKGKRSGNTTLHGLEKNGVTGEIV